MTFFALGSTFDEFPNNANSLFKNFSGVGASITLNGAKTLARCVAPSGAYANFSRQFYLRPGQEIVAEVEAWATSGEGRIGFDVKGGPNKRTDIARESITSKHAQNYIVRHQANHFMPEVVNFFCGVTTAPDGDVFIRMPRIQSSKNDFPAMRVIASVLLSITGGAGAGQAVIATDPSFPTFGIAGVTRLSATAFDIELAEPLASIYADGNLDDVRGAKPYLSIESVGAGNVPFIAKAYDWLDSDVMPVRNKIKFSVINVAAAGTTNNPSNLKDWDAHTGVENFRVLCYML